MPPFPFPIATAYTVVGGFVSPSSEVGLRRSTVYRGWTKHAINRTLRDEKKELKKPTTGKKIYKDIS